MKGVATIVAACLIVMATVAMGAEQRNNPAATLQRYLDAVNSADYNGLMDVVSDDLAPFKYAACTPQMSSKTCFGTFVTETIFKRNGSLISPSAKYNGDVVAAVIELRHDGTRAAHVPRRIGVDTITVKNNKIVSFKWEQDPNDAANKKFAAYNAAIAAAPAAASGPANQSAPTRITGTLTSISSDGLKIRDANGQETSMGVAPTVTVLAARPVAKDSIKAGDFVASANLSETEGVGRSIELRLFEPGSRAGEGNRPMTQAGAAPGQMMTNATVTKVAQTSAGLELDVQFPGGARHLVVPADVTIIGSYPVDPASLKPGMAVAVTATRDADGTLRATRVQIAASPPAAR